MAKPKDDTKSDKTLTSSTKVDSVNTKTPTLKSIVNEKSFYKTDGEIDKAEVLAMKRVASIQTEFQVIGCSHLVRLSETGDIRPARRLIERMTFGSKASALRVDSMVEWLEKYGQIRYDSDLKQLVYDKSKTLQLAAAMQKPWWKAKAQSVYKPFDLVAKLKELYAATVQKLDADKLDPAKGDNVNIELLNKIGALYEEYAEHPEIDTGEHNLGEDGEGEETQDETIDGTATEPVAQKREAA